MTLKESRVIGLQCRRRKILFALCKECGGNSRMSIQENAGNATGPATRKICQKIEAGQEHFVEAAGGQSFVRVDSLIGGLVMKVLVRIVHWSVCLSFLPAPADGRGQRDYTFREMIPLTRPISFLMRTGNVPRAALVAGSRPREMYQKIEAGYVHFIEACDGNLWLCPESAKEV